jgi:predicted TIM-barrel fold metal-dependent hydrolase
MIIDAHVHLGWSSDYKLSARQLVLMMDRNRVDRAITVPMTSSWRHNKHLFEELRHHLDRLIGFIWVNPRSLGALISLSSQAGFGGFKLRSESDMYRMDDIRLLKPIFENARRLKRPIFIHSSGVGSASAPDAIAKIAAAFPDLTILMGHMGGGTREAIDVGCKHTNILFDTSGIEDPRVISWAVRVLGPERIVFGSDLPYCNQRSEIAKIEALDLPGEHKKMVMGGNAERVLGL